MILIVLFCSVLSSVCLQIELDLFAYSIVPRVCVAVCLWHIKSTNNCPIYAFDKLRIYQRGSEWEICEITMDWVWHAHPGTTIHPSIHSAATGIGINRTFCSEQQQQLKCRTIPCRSFQVICIFPWISNNSIASRRILSDDADADGWYDMIPLKWPSLHWNDNEQQEKRRRRR